jgi:M6 family metalloprotease-like protein
MKCLARVIIGGVCAALFLLPHLTRAAPRSRVSEDIVLNPYPTYRVAVLLVTFSDVSEKPSGWTKEAFNERLFTNADSMAAFYQAASADAVTITGEVFDNDGAWYTIARPSASGSTCDWDSFFDDAVAAADADVNFALFNSVLVFSPTLACSTGGHSWAVSITDASGAYYPAAEVDSTTALTDSMAHHEFGHIIGMDHANSWECTAPNILTGSGCQLVEYGDRFSVMGVSSRMLYPAAPHRENLGWLTTSEITTVTADGDYAIAYSESAEKVPKVLKIPKSRNAAGSVTDWYYLEYRQAVGFDNITRTPTLDELGVTKGALVHVGSSEGTYITTTLLDMTPGSIPDHDIFDPALPLGSSYLDSTAGVSFGVLSRNASSMTIRVRLDGESVCQRRVPTVTVKKSKLSGKAGSTLGYILTVKNASRLCGAQTIELRTVKAPKGWTVTVNKKKSTSALFSVGASKKFTIRVTPKRTAQPGTSTIKIETRLKDAKATKKTTSLKATVRR